MRRRLPELEDKQEQKFCVYAHSIKDEVFYIGHGNSQRPYVFGGRTSRWREFVAVNGIFCIEVCFWTDDRHEAQEIEHALICDYEPVCNVFTKLETRIYRSMERLIFRIDPPVRIALEKAAEADARTLSSLVQKVLAEHVRETGFLK
jgi:hypothetical protein